jgi:hypothetical protein
VQRAPAHPNPEAGGLDMPAQGATIVTARPTSASIMPLRSRVLPLSCLALLSVDLASQQRLGATYRTTPSVASRGALLGFGGTLVARFDHDDYVGWGRTTATPNRRAVHGVTFQAEDKDGSTAESYRIVVYTEDPTAPGFPDLGNPLLALGPFQNAVRPVGIAQFTLSHVFAAPLEVPADRDVFVGVEVGPVANWPNDGFSVSCTLGAPSTWPLHDDPGPAPIQHGSYGLAIDGAGLRFYNSRRQLSIDLLCDAPGGACTAVTSQATYPIGAVPPGNGGYLSALHVDAVRPSTNPGRADDPGFAFLDPSLANGTLVLFLADFGTFGNELPLRTFVPGSIGVACLKTSSITISLGQIAGGVCTNVMQIGGPVRTVLSGLPLLQQGIALTTANTLRGSPCCRQMF